MTMFRTLAVFLLIPVMCPAQSKEQEYKLTVDAKQLSKKEKIEVVELVKKSIYEYSPQLKARIDGGKETTLKIREDATVLFIRFVKGNKKYQNDDAILRKIILDRDTKVICRDPAIKVSFDEIHCSYCSDEYGATDYWVELYFKIDAELSYDDETVLQTFKKHESTSNYLGVAHQSSKDDLGSLTLKFKSFDDYVKHLGDAKVTVRMKDGWEWDDGYDDPFKYDDKDSRELKDFDTKPKQEKTRIKFTAEGSKMHLEFTAELLKSIEVQ